MEMLSPKSIDFLWELTLNNQRPWFQAHKEEFTAVLNKPFQALARETERLLKEKLPKRDLRLHISRIYRDARRLFGRGPYQDNLWFSLQEKNASDQGPVFWFELNREGTSHGVGFWERNARQGELFRQRIGRDPKAFERLVVGLPEGFRLWGEEYKRPKGSFGPVIDPWYNRKQVSVGWDNYCGQELFGPRLPKLLTVSFISLLPVYELFLSVYQEAKEEKLREEQNSLWGISGGKHGDH